MERRRSVPGPDGNPIPADEIGFRAVGEHWNEYLLDDGTVLKMKLVVTSVHRLADGSIDAKGNPVYLCESTNVMSVSGVALEDRGS